MRVLLTHQELVVLRHMCSLRHAALVAASRVIRTQLKRLRLWTPQQVRGDANVKIMHTKQILEVW